MGRGKSSSCHILLLTLIHHPPHLPIRLSGFIISPQGLCSRLEPRVAGARLKEDGYENVTLARFIFPPQINPFPNSSFIAAARRRPDTADPPTIWPTPDGRTNTDLRLRRQTPLSSGPYRAVSPPLTVEGSSNGSQPRSGGGGRTNKGTQPPTRGERTPSAWETGHDSAAAAAGGRGARDQIDHRYHTSKAISSKHGSK